MRRIDGPHSIVFLTLALALCLTTTPAAATEDDPTAYDRMVQAIRGAGSVHARAEVLAKLAWPAEPGDDPELAAMARDSLAHYGKEGIATLRKFLRRVQPIHQADVTAALIQANAQISWGKSEDYLPALEEAIWFGTEDAKRLAIAEVTRYKYQPAMLTVMDAAFEHPELTEMVVLSLGEYGDDKARHFLGRVMREGSPRERDLAARSLAKIGKRAKSTLMDLALTGEPGVRSVAVRMLVPVTDPNDLTMLYDYLGRHDDDDPVIVDLVRSRIAQIEEFLDTLEPVDGD